MAHPSNPLALAVLALLFEQPMHPYEMAATLKRRRKEESIKLRYGSLYTVIDQLLARGLIAAAETSREGKRPERTIYSLTPAGLKELRTWMSDLLRDPAKEYPQFEAALCLLGVLPPEDATALLFRRALNLARTAAEIEGELATLAEQDLGAIAAGENLPPELAAQKFPALFYVESEYRLAMIKAELAFVKRLARRIVDDGWGPVDIWRDLQAMYAEQHLHQAGSNRA